jgi:hypothetical protein
LGGVVVKKTMREGVTVTLHLFLEPADELIPAGKFPSAAEVRDLAKGLHERLCRVADILEKLDQDGWTIHQGVHEITCYHNDLDSEEQVAERLQALGIDPSDVSIIPWSAEDEGEEEPPLTKEELKDLFRFLKWKVDPRNRTQPPLALTRHWVRCRPFRDRKAVLRYLRSAYGDSDDQVLVNLFHD